MTAKEMSDIVRANLHKSVKITYQSGETDVAVVITVDDEGFVYSLTTLAPGVRETEFWTSFSEISNIESEN